MSLIRRNFLKLVGMVGAVAAPVAVAAADSLGIFHIAEAFISEENLNSYQIIDCFNNIKSKTYKMN